ncbi:MAG: FAD-dependent monooxygenase [Candidatus Binatia bacterium]|nr:FAD-dependent monooxygenase [Candidatus Binatia bacterium]
MIETKVLIAGGGPVGLVLALELEQRGVSALLVERNLTTTQHPKMDVTNGRSMEHFRRLGIADEIRSHAVPSDHSMDVLWCSKLAEWEIARFAYPSVETAREIIRYVNDGTLALEPYMRISQVVLEPVLKQLLEARGGHVSTRFGWALDSFEEDADGVDVTIRNSETGDLESVRAAYLAGCDGAASVTRKGLGIDFEYASVGQLLRGMGGGVLKAVGSMMRGLVRGERRLDGRFYLIHFRSTDRPFFERFGRVWHIQAPVSGTLIAQNDLDTWTLHVPLRAGVDTDTLDPKKVLFDALGREFACEIIVASAWTPRLAMAKSYGRGRVWLAGDSAHQMIPTGGYGMNTGVGDAVDLGWKLAAVLEGWGGPGLLPSYETERLPVGCRNRDTSVRHASVRMQISAAASPKIHEDSTKGEGSRGKLAEQIRTLGNLENEARGIELGYRYDGSPIICAEEGEAPTWSQEEYVPSTWPGARPPSVILEDGRGLFDLFGPGFTLLRFAEVPVNALVEAARECGLPLWLVDVRDENARRLYERDLVLVRPDQHVAWRGDTAPSDAGAVLDRVRGAG